MHYFHWLLRAILFLLLLGFAVKNDQPVTLRFLLGSVWETSLVVVILLVLILGALIGITAMLGVCMRQRGEMAALRRELNGLKKTKPAEAREALPETHPE